MSDNSKHTTIQEPCNPILTLRTIQIAPFRTALSALKNILIETNITFEPDGMKIINMDKSHTILVHLFLEAINFEFYECKKDKIIIGVNMQHLFKLINIIENEETLTIYIEESDYDDGIVTNLTVSFENGTIKQCRSYKMKLIEPDSEELQYPDVTFSSILNMPSADFQKIVSDFSTLSFEKIEIKSVGSDLWFKCTGNGPYAIGQIVRSETDKSMGIVSMQNYTKVTLGDFLIKNLLCVIKCTNLCPQIELYLENDMPLMIKYDVASLGFLRLCLAQAPSSC
jgi:proliferating cell nuclear antigen